MLVRKESVCEVLDCGVDTIEEMVKSNQFKIVDNYGEELVDYTTVENHFNDEDCLSIEYFTKEDGVVSDFLSDEKIKEISDFNSVVMFRFSGLDRIKSNTFIVNPIVNYDKFSLGETYKVEKNGFCLEEIDEITLELNHIFSPKRVRFINDVIDNTQFWYSNIDISDYSIIKYNGLIIVFHLDLMNGYGITINSIWREKDIELKKDFPKSISIPLDKEFYTKQKIQLVS